LPASETDKLPLFGIPFSLKENFGISGYQCTVGASKLIDDSSTDHTCPTVRVSVALYQHWFLTLRVNSSNGFFANIINLDFQKKNAVLDSLLIMNLKSSILFKII